MSTSRRQGVVPSLIVLLWLLTVPVSLRAEDASTNTVASTRILSILPLPRLDPPPMVLDFLGALDLAYAAGARGDFASTTWSAVEPTAGMLDVRDFGGGLAYLGNLRGLTLLVGIQLLNSTVKETPQDLLNVPFDSAVMQERFRALIDALLPYFSEHVVYLSIGNEVDLYLDAHPDEWPQYTTFYTDAAAYVRSVAPGVQVGVTATFDGANGGAASRVAALNASSDVFILTYYPTPHGPQAPLTDFPQMVALANGRPVILQEVGYASSPVLSSSADQQASYVATVFTAWDSAADHIPFLSYFALHDLTPDACSSLAQYYGLADNVNFEAFLCSLGLRHANGTPKPGWRAFVDAAAASGFPTAHPSRVIGCIYGADCMGDDINADETVTAADVVAATRTLL